MHSIVLHQNAGLMCHSVEANTQICQSEYELDNGNGNKLENQRKI